MTAAPPFGPEEARALLTRANYIRHESADVEDWERAPYTITYPTPLVQTLWVRFSEHGITVISAHGPVGFVPWGGPECATLFRAGLAFLTGQPGLLGGEG